MHQDQLDAKKTALEIESKKYAKKTDEIVTQEDVTSDVAQQYAPSSEISISQTAQKVNSDAENNFAELEQRLSELDARLEYLKNESNRVGVVSFGTQRHFLRSFFVYLSHLSQREFI